MRVLLPAKRYQQTVINPTMQHKMQRHLVCDNLTLGQFFFWRWWSQFDPLENVATIP